MKTTKLLIAYCILLVSLMTCTTVNQTLPPSTTSTTTPTQPSVQKPQPQPLVVTKPVSVPYVSYNANGSATWYQLADHGLQTSSGDVYDLYGKTAAHASLPLGSRIRITNLANGKSEVAIINDRIRSDDSLIRVSYIVAKQLQLLGKSRSQVNVTTLPPLK